MSNNEIIERKSEKYLDECISAGDFVELKDVVKNSILNGMVVLVLSVNAENKRAKVALGGKVLSVSFVNVKKTGEDFHIDNDRIKHLVKKEDSYKNLSYKSMSKVRMKLIREEISFFTKYRLNELAHERSKQTRRRRRKKTDSVSNKLLISSYSPDAAENEAKNQVPLGDNVEDVNASDSVFEGSLPSPVPPGVSSERAHISNGSGQNLLHGHSPISNLVEKLYDLGASAPTSMLGEIDTDKLGEVIQKNPEDQGDIKQTTKSVLEKLGMDIPTILSKVEMLRSDPEITSDGEKSAQLQSLMTIAGMLQKQQT
eukprot:augustus_masked-scaffold_5-processed-gene-17.5-mRNA-1 protein AED:1.00 eAED:1.00 QI:0/-1/0/0/-1/1/1/0/312